MKKILIFSLIFLLTFIAVARAATPYTVGMTGGNNSGIANRLYQEKANFMIIGDSKSVDNQASRPRYGAIRTFRPKYGWKGMTCPWSAVQGGGCFTVNEFELANTTSITMGGSYRDNSSGWNIMDARWYNFTIDMTGFTTFAVTGIDSGYFTQYKNSTGLNYQWWQNNTMTARFIYLPDFNSTWLGVNTILSNGSQPTPVHGQPYLFNNTGTQRTLRYYDLDMNASSGGSQPGLAFTSWDANESSPNKSTFNPIAIRYFIPNQTNGFEFDASAASSNWQMPCHLQGSECPTLNSYSYVSNYSDQAIIQMINASDINTFMIYLGNIGGGESDGGGHPINGTFQNHTELVIERYIRDYYIAKPTAGINNTDRPYFILMSEQDRSNNDEFRIEQEYELENLTRYQKSYPNIAMNATVGIFKQRSKVNDSIGAYTVLNSSGYFLDGLHQNYSMAELQMGLFWNSSMNSITPVNGSLSTFNFTLNSDTIINTTTGSNQVLFNNTDIYTQGINFSGATNMLVWSPAYTYRNIYGNNLANLGSAKYDNVTNATGTVNITIEPSQIVYALNYYNITQGLTRSNDPLVVNSITSTSIVLSNPSLVNTVTVPVIMQLNSSWGTACSNVAMMNYTTESNVKYGWQGQSAINACNNLTTVGLSLPIEQSVASNTLLITLQSTNAFVCTTGDRSVSGLIIIAGAFLILSPFFFVFLKNGGNFMDVFEEIDMKFMLITFIIIMVGTAMLISSAQSLGAMCG